jgi:hypothetical protein
MFGQHFVPVLLIKLRNQPRRQTSKVKCEADDISKTPAENAKVTITNARSGCCYWNNAESPSADPPDQIDVFHNGHVLEATQAIVVSSPDQ